MMLSNSGWSPKHKNDERDAQKKTSSEKMKCRVETHTGPLLKAREEVEMNLILQ